MKEDEQPSGENRAIQKAEYYPLSFPVRYPAQQEEEVHLRDYIRVILRRKWSVMTFFFIVLITVVIGTFLTKPLYRSFVMIKIDKENPNVLKFKDVYEVERADDDYYQTQFRVLKSRSLAKRVIRSMKLDQNPEFSGRRDPAQKESTDTGNAGARVMDGEINPKIVDSFLNKVSVEPQQKSRLVKVGFESGSPLLAAEVANEIAKSYIDFNVESKFNATQQARDWLEKQIEEMKAKVERAEEALNKYASQNGIIFLTEGSPGEKRDLPGENILTKRLSELSSSLSQASSDRISKEALYREAQNEDGESLSAVLNNPLIQALKKDYAALEAEYSQQSRTYKADYPKMVRLKEQMNQLKARIDLETKKTVKGLKRDYEAAVKRETYLQASLKKATAEASGMNEKMVQYNILKRDAEANRELYNGLLQRLKETGVSVSLTTSNIQVLDRAEAPRKPQKPNVMLNCMLAVFFGLFGGVGLAFFMEYLDNTFKSQEELERVVALPSLGIVPDFSKKGGAGAAAITFEDTRSPLSEAYRSIGTYVQFSSGGRPPKTILVTSANEGEGKTTTAANLAISLARSVGKGIIVDADMRRARLHRVFDIDNSRGLSAFLAGHIEFGDGLIHKTGVGNLDAIPSGILPPNPSDLLSSYRMKDLINGLFSLYSFVVIDSPPLLGLSDSCILSTLTDGVIMVTKSGVTQKDAALQAKRLLQGVNAKILGVVLNSISETDLKYGMYSYNYYRKGYDDEGNGKRKRDT